SPQTSISCPQKDTLSTGDLTRTLTRENAQLDGSGTVRVIFTNLNCLESPRVIVLCISKGGSTQSFGVAKFVNAEHNSAEVRRQYETSDSDRGVFGSKQQSVYANISRWHYRLDCLQLSKKAAIRWLA